MTDKTDPRLDAPGDPDARMNAYYYSFNRTGVGIVDAILSAVATAGKRYHHTESWADPWGEGERQQVELIQEAADAAAEAIRNHAADTESLRAECVRRQADWDDAAAGAATVVADAARSTAGIVRVDTNDEALIERLVEVRWRTAFRYGCPLSEREQATLRRHMWGNVRATLAALREAS